MSNSSMNRKLAKSLHFYRVVLDQTHKIALPKRFVSVYGNDLSNTVILIAPSGREWHVELMKCGVEIWLSNGWKDFADHFCLKYGNLLIFKYEGHSRFYVFMIFDQTTFEIEYPIDINTSSKNGDHDAEKLETPRVEEVESDDSVEIVDDISRSRKTKEESLVRRFRPRKRTRSTTRIVTKGDEDVKKPEFRMTRRYGSKINPKEAGGGTSAARLSSTSSRANCFGSENLSFVVNVRKPHIKGSYVHIPVAVVRNSWLRNEAKVVALKDQDGETWPVHLVVDKRKNYLALGCGWIAFARYKDLQVGDSCAYELLEEPEISFRVTIFRNSEDSNDRHTDAHGRKTGRARRERESNMQSRFGCDYSEKDDKESHVPRRRIKTKNRRFGESMQNKTETGGRAVQRISSEGIARSLERVSEFGSVHPFFKVVVTANFLQVGHPSIPDSFCYENIERIPADVTLEFKGKSWPLRIVSCVDRRGRLSGGWHVFASENKLRVGDVCVFEMIKKTNIVFKVSIFRDGSTIGVSRC